MFFLRHRSQKVCKNPFPMTIPFWLCLLLCQCASYISLTHGQRRAKWNIVWILFFFYSLDVSNAFMDSPAHYLAPFLMCASVVPREKVVWSVREKGPVPGVTVPSWGHTFPNSLSLCGQQTSQHFHISPLEVHIQESEPPTKASESASSKRWPWCG